MSIPIIVLCGFLGSGKTTLLRRWRRQESLQDAVVIVHDLSDFGLDAELVGGDESPTMAGQMRGRVAALHGSHARDHLKTSLGKTLNDICELHPAPSVVLVESTGAAHPWPLISALSQNGNFHLRHFIVTVDALNLHRDYDDGGALVGQQIDEGLRAAASILLEQVRFASVIVVTKIDAIPKGIIDSMVRHLRCINPRAVVALSAQAGLLPEQLKDVVAPSLTAMKKVAESLELTSEGTSSTAETMDCVIFKDQRPFHPQRLWECCLEHLGTGLYRTKGFLWLASRPGDVLLWQQAGSQISLEFTGIWRAEMLLDKERKLLPEEIEFLKQRLAREHPVFGDRHNELTLIGLDSAREDFAARFADCLCTQQEIEAWQNGAEFTDPWPRTFVKL